MPIFTPLKKVSEEKAGLGLYADGMVDRTAMSARPSISTKSPVSRRTLS